MAIGKSAGMLLAALACSCAVKLPIEVAGDPGTSESLILNVPPASGTQIRSLWLQIHGLGFDGMASVRVNHGVWVALNNQTVTIAEPGRSYGGIGGGFATLRMTLPLAVGGVADGPNTIEFRFNHSNGIVSGFRVLALNFLAEDGRKIIPPAAFVAENPNEWRPPLGDPESVAKGRDLWHTAALAANSSPSAPWIRAHCSDCHTQDGRDLKYFNFSNASIEARSRFHGLSELEGMQIASYIRSLPFPNPGRPWNPPYQPGPGLDAQPVANWAAGAGLASVLEKDVETLPYLDPAAFAPDGNLNPREIPIALQLPDWNHWLPRVHPLDAWPGHFAGSDFARTYETISPNGGISLFDKWTTSRAKFLTPHLARTSLDWSPALAEAMYSAQLWELVKTWEIIQKYSLEASRSWPNRVPAATAPDAVNIPDGPNGMGASALTNQYFSNAWYELQLVVNSGTHRRHDRSPVDWVYVIPRFLSLQRQSGMPEPGRLLIAVIKAMQSNDPKMGPENTAEGWRPDENIDPRILVAGGWDAVFRSVPAATRREITERLLTGWMDKTSQYRVSAYFHRGLVGGYAPPAEIREVSGGRVWEAASQFQALGVSALLIRRIRDWGEKYTDAAARFQYSE
jgi:hypothetical protein